MVIFGKIIITIILLSMLYGVVVTGIDLSQLSFPYEKSMLEKIFAFFWFVALIFGLVYFIYETIF